MGVPKKGSRGAREEALGVWMSAARGLLETRVTFNEKSKPTEKMFSISVCVCLAHVLAGELCGVAPLPDHTSSILTRTLLMKPALDITFSLAERLVMVDSGCGRGTGRWRVTTC